LKTPITILFVIVFFLEVSAQHYTHDLGIFVGSSSLQSDYGARNNFASNQKNNGLSFAVAHYLHFFNRTLRWDPNNVMHNHLMVKTDLRYNSDTKLEHFGKWASRDSYAAEQLRAMKGTVRMFDVGVSLEYYLFSLEEFVYPYSDISFNPFFTFGFKYSFYNNSLSSSLGDWKQDINLLPSKYTADGALNIGSGEAASMVTGLGTRYKITERLDFSAQFTFQYFFSDEVDGLQAQVFENKNNEWLMNIQFGLVYHLNFSSPLF
jgi:hypothetical protein